MALRLGTLFPTTSENLEKINLLIKEGYTFSVYDDCNIILFRGSVKETNHVKCILTGGVSAY